MKSKTIKCKKCHQETTANGNAKKYCLQCARIMVYTSNAHYRLKQRRARNMRCRFCGKDLTHQIWKKNCCGSIKCSALQRKEAQRRWRAKKKKNRINNLINN